MSTTKLLRWSGLASILAGVLFTIATVLHPPGEDVPAIITAAWVPAHAIGWVANLLLLLGLVGCMAGKQKRRVGWGCWALCWPLSASRWSRVGIMAPLL